MIRSADAALVVVEAGEVDPALQEPGDAQLREGAVGRHQVAGVVAVPVSMMGPGTFVPCRSQVRGHLVLQHAFEQGPKAAEEARRNLPPHRSLDILRDLPYTMS